MPFYQNTSHRKRIVLRAKFVNLMLTIVHTMPWTSGALGYILMQSGRRVYHVAL